MLSDKTKRRLTHHTPLALCGGVVVFIILNIAAWYNFRAIPNVCPRQGYTKMTLGSLKHQLVRYLEEQGKYPEKLTDMSNVRGGMWFSANEKDESAPQDEWGNRIHYEPDETTYELYSLGRDGQPGGVGLDADLYSDGRNEEKSLPTFWQFFGETDAAEVARNSFFIAGVLAGGMTCWIVFMMLDVPSHAGRNVKLRELVVYTLVVIGISTVVGIILLPLHIPSGH